MERAERLFSWTKKLLAAAVSAGFMTGCATTARDLPQDYSSMDAPRRSSLQDFDAASVSYRYNKALNIFERLSTVELTCAEIDEALKILEGDYALQAQDITNKRLQNQAAGYIAGALFPPALLAIDNSSEAKDKIESINRAKDELYKLQAFKKCSGTSGMDAPKRQ